MKAKKPLHHPPHLYEMAHGLNLERRLYPRVKFPVQSWKDFSGPVVRFENHPVSLIDLSEGGVCLEDSQDLMQFKIGQEFCLKIECDGLFEVQSRMVAMNLARRHIQFLNPSNDLKINLRRWIQTGLRGQWLKQVSYENQEHTSSILWASIYDDSLAYSPDSRWEFRLGLDDKIFLLSADFWPVTEGDLKPISVDEFDQMLVFLENLSFSNEISSNIRNFLSGIRRRSFE